MPGIRELTLIPSHTQFCMSWISKMCCFDLLSSSEFTVSTSIPGHQPSRGLLSQPPPWSSCYHLDPSILFHIVSTMTSKHKSESVSPCLKPWYLPIPFRMKTKLLHVASLQCLPLATLPGSFPTAPPCVFQACWGSLFSTTNHSVPSPNDSFSFLFARWFLLNPFNFSWIITSSEKSSLT